MKIAIVTITAGDRYAQMAELTHPTIKAYAQKVGAKFIDWRDCSAHTYPDWQKLEILPLFEREGFDRVAFIDADMIVRPDTPNLFEIVPHNSFTAFNEFPFKERITTMRQYLEGEPLRQWGARKLYFNAGMFVCSTAHKAVFTPPDRERTGFYFQSYMNYQLFTLGLETMCLDRRFNHIEGIDPYLAASRHDCYILHYAGNGMETDALLDLIRDDLRVWELAATEYRFRKPLRRRILAAAKRLRRLF